MIYHTKHCRLFVTSILVVTQNILHDAYNRQKQLAAPKEDEADSTIVRRWSQVEKDPNYRPTLVERDAGRLFISETDPPANKTRSQHGKCSISCKFHRVRAFTAGSWTRCRDSIVFYRFLFCNHEVHSFQTRPFRFPSLSLGIAVSAAWSLWHCSRCLRGRVSARASLFSRLSLIWNHTQQFRLFCAFSILSSASWVASDPRKVTRV